MKRFNIRVYGLWVKNGKLLLSDEFRLGTYMTKMPGGGLEHGEGPAEALKREWMEELGVEVHVGDIFYVNPFLQVSAFDSNDEIVAMYFWVKPLAEPKVKISEQAFDFQRGVGEEQSFRWKAISELDEGTMTFPIDKAMAVHLRKYLLEKKRL